MGIIDVLNGSAEKVASHLKNATDFDLTYVFDVNDEMPERIEIVSNDGVIDIDLKYAGKRQLPNLSSVISFLVLMGRRIRPNEDCRFGISGEYGCDTVFNVEDLECLPIEGEDSEEEIELAALVASLSSTVSEAPTESDALKRLKLLDEI